jgi:hypothetical protein
MASYLAGIALAPVNSYPRTGGYRPAASAPSSQDCWVGGRHQASRPTWAALFLWGGVKPTIRGANG